MDKNQNCFIIRIVWTPNKFYFMKIIFDFFIRLYEIDEE